MNASSPSDTPSPAVATPLGPPAGYFGKVPTHGDFVVHRVERTLREPFDAWLSAGIQASRARLGEGWLSAYLVAPIWRFAMSAGVCGPDAVAGVMMPGVDRVGRYFPLVLAATLPEHRGGVSWLCRHRDWFEAAERLVASTLRDDFRLADFDAAVLQMHAPPANEEAARDVKPHSMWWTTGSDNVAPLATAALGLPDPDEFHVLLTGDTSDTSLRTTTFAPGGSDAAPAAPVPQRSVPVCRAAALTHPGTRSQVNADAVHVSPRGDVFALAAGSGTDRHAAQAAGICTQALADVAAAPSLSDLLAEVKGKLGRAHTRLRAGLGIGATSTASVVALVTQGDRYAIAWVGDARLYLRESGMLRLVTRDHVEVGLERRLARAVGGASPLAVQTAGGPLREGDRFVLCSNPLARALDDRTVAGAVVEGDADASARRLVEEALVAGTAGSVTAMVVDVCAAERGGE